MKPICVPCQRFMRAKRNGFYFVEGKPYGGLEAWDGQSGKDSVGWTAYKLWVGDLWECPGCHTQTVAGVAHSRVAEHYENDFEDKLTRTGAMQNLFVKDC